MLHLNFFVRDTTPQYRLDPPDILAFSSNPPKLKRNDSLSESLTGAAIAFANTFRNSSERLNTSDNTVGGMSPRKTVELRMKQLFEDNILSEAEYKEQKESILKALRNLVLMHSKIYVCPMSLM